MATDPNFDDVTLDSMLGAYALDALDPDEAAAVDRYLARVPEAAGEVEQLRTAAAWIGAAEALAPPASLRDSVLLAARTNGAIADVALSGYVHQAEAFDAVVDELPERVFGRATPNGLCVRDLVIHMAAMESLLAATVGRPIEPAIEETDIGRRTEQFVERFATRPLEAARDVWRRSVRAVRAWSIDPAHADEHVTCFGLYLSRDSLLLTRAFEIWTHADDLRRCLELPATPPDAETLHGMANMSVSAMPIALVVAGRAHDDKSARIVLTGAGGGSWLIPLGHGAVVEPPDLVLTMDTVDWCLLVAERLAPDAVSYAVEGDSSLVADLTNAASTFATL